MSPAKEIEEEKKEELIPLNKRAVPTSKEKKKMIPVKSTKSGGKSVRAEATPQPTNEAEISVTSPDQPTKKENERNETRQQVARMLT